MFHRLLCIILAALLAWVPTASALPSSDIDKMVEAIQLGKMDVKEQTLKEFVQNIQKHLPPKMAADWQALAKIYPNLKIPKVIVKRVKSGAGEEKLQLLIEGTPSAVVTVENQEVKIDAVVAGKAVSYKFDRDIFEYGPKVFALPRTTKAWNFDQKSWAKLSVKDKYKYWKNVQQLLVKIENVENAFRKTKQVKTSSLFIQNAWADNCEPCIAAGYMSCYDSRPQFSKYCNIPESGIKYDALTGDAEVTCSSDFFPPETAKWPIKNPSKPLSVSNMTKICSETLSPNDPEKYKNLVMKDNGRALEDKMQGAKFYCQQGGLSADQESTCKALDAHFTKILGYCVDLAKTHTKEKFYCRSIEEKSAERSTEAVNTASGPLKTGVTNETVQAAGTTVDTKEEKESRGEGWDKITNFLGNIFSNPITWVVGAIVGISWLTTRERNKGIDAAYRNFGNQNGMIAPTQYNYLNPTGVY